MVYAALVRRLVRRNIARLNAGEPGDLLAMAAPDVVLRFPGDNRSARMFRPVVKGRQPHDTHRGLEECRAFADAFVEQRIQFVIEDVLVNGPPWRTRVAIRLHDFAPAADGSDDYTNRAVAFLELRWGRLVVWEDYEDTERSADWDARRELAASEA
ncbi:MAG TPA: nuclear transport factor 2 family protein [Friedmanniella sp.]